MVFDEGVVVSRKAMDAVDEQEKFKMYYEYKEPVKTIPSHRMLAIRRGESENVLYFLIEIEAERAVAIIQRKVLRVRGDWTPSARARHRRCMETALEFFYPGRDSTGVEKAF